MANTLNLLGAVTVSSNTGTITFSSVDQTYTDLLLKFSTRSTNTDSADAWDTIIKFNDSATGLTFKSIRGDGSGVNYNSLTDRMLRTTVTDNWTASVFSNVEIYIPNYTGSTNKSFNVEGVLENNAAGSPQIMIAGTWANSAAITKVSLETNSGLFMTNSTAYLYGIKNS